MNQNKDDRERGGSISKGRKPRRDGNWDNTVIDGTTDTRTHNSVNELTARTNPSTSLTYDIAAPVVAADCHRINP